MSERERLNNHPFYLESQEHTGAIRNHEGLISSVDASGWAISIVIEERNTDVNHNKTDNQLLGILFMLLFVLLLSLFHIMLKYQMTIHPYISAYDASLWMSWVGVIILYVIGKTQQMDMNIFNFGKTVTLLMIIRWLIGVSNNLFFLLSMSYIALSKCIMIFSLNPVCCAILAAIVLKEQLSSVTIVSCLCAWGGVYLLTLNKEETTSNEHEGTCISFNLV